MSIKVIISKIYRRISNYILRKRLKNSNFSIFAPTCIAGVIYHRLGLEFLSPTINLFMNEHDFILFASDLEWYLNTELIFLKNIDRNNADGTYPMAYLPSRNGDEKVTINFNHYSSFEQAREKWEQRKKRVNLDNAFFVFSTNGNQLTEEDVNNIKKVKAKGVVLFTGSKYSEYDYSLPLKKYKNDLYVKPYMVSDISSVLNKMVWEDNFDYVYWLNTGKVKRK